MSRKQLFATIAGTVLCCLVAPLRAQTGDSDTPAANPGRPTVSTPAALTPVGYLQFENGALLAVQSPEFTTQIGINQTTKLTVTPRIELLAISEPVAHSVGEGGGDQPGDVSAGLQAVAVAGKGRTPTVSFSYLRRVYEGPAPNLDLGSFRQSALFLLSEDLGGFHFDINGIFNEQADSKVRRGQFGQTLSVSRDVGRATIVGELWHYTQPLVDGNAVGNLWALSYALKKNLVIDGGFDHGFTSSSTRWEGFAGFTYLLPHRLWRSGR